MAKAPLPLESEFPVSPKDILLGLEANKRIPSVAQFLAAVGDKVGIDNLAQMFADVLTSGSDRLKAEFILDFVTILKHHEKMRGTITEDRLTQLADSQLLDVLRSMGVEETAAEQVAAEMAAETNGSDHS